MAEFEMLLTGARGTRIKMVECSIIPASYRAFFDRMGPYHYHKMIVADARDGEYPMLTLDGLRPKLPRPTRSWIVQLVLRNGGQQRNLSLG